MFLFNALRGLRRRSAPRRAVPGPGPGRRRNRALAIEELESRTLLSYSFTLIADDSPRGPFSNLITLPAINSAGAMVVHGTLRGGGQAIFTGSGGPLTFIAYTGGTFISPGVINSGGTVDYVVEPEPGQGRSFFTSSGWPLIPTLIADTSPGSPFSTFNGGYINDGGTVGFRAILTIGDTGIFTGQGDGLPNMMYITGGPISDIIGVRGFNNSGTVAFRGTLNGGEQGLYTGNGGPLNTIAVTGDRFYDLGGSSLNDAGAVAFQATRADDREAILIGDGGEPTEIVTAGDVFRSLASSAAGLALNNAGAVAFVASLSAGGRGIFTGPDPVGDKVIAEGDPLFGSTVEMLPTNTIPPRGLNDSGQIAFDCFLADGRQVIVRADPDGNAPAGFPPSRNRAGLVHSGVSNLLPGGVSVTQDLNVSPLDPLRQPTDRSPPLAIVDTGPVVSRGSENLSTHLGSAIPGEIFDQVFADFETRALGDAMAGV